MTQGKLLKNINGYDIEKTWEVNERTNKEIKGSIIYMVYKDDDLVDGFKSLREATKYAREN